MRERRQIDRKYLAVYSRVFDRVTAKVLGYLADLSQNGTMLISDDPLPEGEYYKLRFDLPDPPLFSVDHLDMDARVAWCRPDVDPAFYNIGFEFKEVNEEEASIIVDMVEAYQFNFYHPEKGSSSDADVDQS
jgi:hypothetical protein